MEINEQTYKARIRKHIMVRQLKTLQLRGIGKIAYASKPPEFAQFANDFTY